MNTRRTTRRQTAATSATTRGSGSSTRPRGVGLTKDPIPRFGAPNKAGSDLSISARGGGSESDEEEEEEADADAPAEQERNLGIESAVGELVVTEAVEVEAAESLNGKQDEELDDMEAKQLMIDLIPALKTSADDFMMRLKEGDNPRKVSKQLMRTKRQQFYLNRENYQTSEITTPFVDWPEPMEEEDAARVGNTLVRTNLVSAMDNVHRIQTGDRSGAHSFLRALNATYPRGFFGRSIDSGLALRIRTAYFVDHLSQQSKRVRPAEFIASVFCKETGSTDFGYVLQNGPYKPLGGEDARKEAEMCSQRAQELLSIMSRDRKNQGVDVLKRRYPVGGLIANLERWALGEYGMLDDAEPQEDIFVDAEQGRRESGATSDTGTQVIRRPPNTEQSLFDGPGSLEALHAAPPSNQEQARASAARNGSARKRPAVADRDDEDYEEEDDPFETDTRSPKPGKRRRRLTPQRQQPRAPARGPLPSSSAPAPTAATEAVPSTILPSSGIDMGAVRHRGSVTSTQARLQQRQPKHGTRTAWSANDTDLLIRLIAKHRAAWASIDKDPTALWDAPGRGQQGCRDKARNLKVDFLLADMPLPPGFDLVALSKKEIARVSAAGRNPDRLEGDLDADGNPTNTLLDGVQDEGIY
ncbi:myb-like DNA-binding domain-containing protein [Purpureocillium lavendulum]|uniref:Myb-like DNA-binding domain-containing protein n=1 Tax=Purpureocillium lavendulum TaxID=1247861 RepID=A0AB34FYY2_9HYPO|nr:myb-like DNA-binding domain-containing protein [Purpureocillium lavendulum]